jgi:hypothetical protein
MLSKLLVERFKYEGILVEITECVKVFRRKEKEVRRKRVKISENLVNLILYSFFLLQIKSPHFSGGAA